MLVGAELHALKLSSCWHSNSVFDLGMDAPSIKALIANAVERCMATRALRQTGVVLFYLIIMRIDDVCMGLLILTHLKKAPSVMNIFFKRRIFELKL